MSYETDKCPVGTSQVAPSPRPLTETVAHSESNLSDLRRNTVLLEQLVTQLSGRSMDDENKEAGPLLNGPLQRLDFLASHTGLEGSKQAALIYQLADLLGLELK